MNGVRQRRKFIENEWLLNYRAWQGWPSQNYMLPLPDGAIHYFIPHARRAVERNVARKVKLLMPSTDWFETYSFDDMSHTQAESVHSLMRYIYKMKYKTKHTISSLARSIELYNYAVLSTSVRIEKTLVWPYQKAADTFSFYIFPDTASNREEATLIFEDTIIPYQIYSSYVDRDDPDKSMYRHIPIEDLHAPEWPYHLVERLAYRGLSAPSDFVQGTGTTRSITEEELSAEKRKTGEQLSKQSKAFVSLTKCYFRINTDWYFTVICNNTKSPAIVRLDEEEHTPLYQWCNTRPLPGELYTNSQMDDIRVLQNLCNTAISQVESNRTQFAEPPIAMDMSQVQRLDHMTYQNRKIWKVDGNPNDIIKSIDTEDTSTNGIRAWQIYLSLMDKGSGGTLAEGQPGRNMPRAGFAMNALMNLNLADIEDSADTQEQELLTPGLQDTYSVLANYVPSSQLFKLPGKAKEAIQTFRMNQLYGEYSFLWVGSIGFQDVQARADKFLRFLEIVSNPVIFQILQQQGKTIDLGEILSFIYSFGMGERGMSKIIIPAQPDPSIQQKMQQDIVFKQQDQQSKLDLERMKQQGLQIKNQTDLTKAQLDMQSKEMDNEGKRLQLVSSFASSNGTGSNK